MSSRSDADLLCPLCQDIFKVPVILSCRHSFCKVCLLNVWASTDAPECPLCKRRSSKNIPPVDLEMKVRSEAALLERASEPVCSLHSERISHFCVDDQQLMCSMCRSSKTHQDHKFKDAEEAAQDHKRELESLLKPLKKKRNLIHQFKGNCDQTAEHIQVQVENTERRIKEEFRKLHQFLQEEEEARLAALKEEQEQKSGKMKETIETLNSDIAALSDTIKVTEQQLRAKDVPFLLNYKAAVERVQQHPLPDDPELLSGALINEAQHLGNLRFNVWNKMKEMVSYRPVILDPNSAHPDLTLFEDLTGVRHGQEKQEVPDNPERIDHFFSVVGSKGFSSGCHSWEVEVGDNTAYVLAVLVGSDHRKGVIWPGLWRIMFCGGEYKSLSPLDTGTDVVVTKNPKRIKVRLDYDGGQLSFHDSDTNAHIHTFTHTFTETLFPYISTWSDVPIKIVPLKVSVVLEPHH
ncbi:nuclear factor 7, ovary-like [Parambassis ranga]|uniref:Nuclear factor 7, ovary-like n=1 Tax=Parambassis ranga TaxID=210632 RepID=A0A6P7KFT5_9TELE|nr:nuclear factor 7, ovary-like [Parambassis ranga]